MNHKKIYLRFIMALVVLSQLAFLPKELSAQVTQGSHTPQINTNAPLHNRVRQVSDQGINYQSVLARYNGRTINYPNVGEVFKLDKVQLKKDLKQLKKLLNATSIRVFLSPQTTHLNELNSLFEICRSEGFKVEFSLFEGESNYEDMSNNQAWLNQVLDLIYHRPETLLITLQRKVNWSHPAAILWVKNMMQTIRKREKSFEYQFKTQKINGLKYVFGLGKKKPFIANSYQVPNQIQLTRNQHLTQPDIYQFNTEVPNHTLRSTFKRVKDLLPQSLVQISNFSSEHDLDEYQQAWLYRYMFYFSKKHHFAYPSVNFLDSHRNGRFYPGIVRADRSLKSAFLYTQIFYQLRTLDVSEHMITESIFSPLASSAQSELNPEIFLKRFLFTYYKQRQYDNVLNYITERNTDFYYKYIQFRVEESILNSHFAKLNEVEILSKTPLKNGSVKFKVKNTFSSSLGDYQFTQFLTLKPTEKRWETSSLSDPEEQISSYQTQHISSAEMQNLKIDIPSGLKIETDLMFTGSQNSHILRFKIQNLGSETIDIKPIELQVQQEQRSNTPPTTLFDYFKNISPQQSVQGYIPFNYSPTKDYVLHLRKVTSEKPEYFDNNLLKSLQIKVTGQSSNTLNIEVFNPNVERAIVPSIFYMIDTPSKMITGEQILTRALLPFEKRRLHIAVSDLKELKQVHLQGKYYPRVNFILNMDEAFRYKTLGYPLKALKKYNYLLKRFDSDIDDFERFRIRREIFDLSIKLNHYQEAIKTALLMSEVSPSIQKRFGPNLAASLYEPFLKKGHYSESLSVLDAFLKRSPDNTKLLETKGYLFKLMKQPKRALEFYLKAYQIKRSGGLAENIAYLYRKQHQADLAIDYFYAALHLQPNKYQLLKEIGYLYKQSNQPQKAIEVYLDYLTHTRDIKIHEELAHLYLKTGQKQMALKQYLILVKSCPNCLKHMEALAYLYKELGQTSQAIYYYRQHARRSNSPLSYQILGDLLLGQHKKEDALRAFSEGLKRCSSHCNTLLKNSGYLSKELGHLPQAMRYYKRYLQQTPDPRLAKELGYLYYQQEQYHAAIPWFKKALSRPNLNTIELRSALGYSYRRSNQPEKAIPLFQGLVKSAPNHASHLNNLVFSLAEKQGSLSEIQWQDIQPHINQLEQQEDFDTFYALGQIYQKSGRTQQAIQTFKRALVLNPEAIEIYKLLAKSYEENQELEKAIHILKEADKRFDADKKTMLLSQNLRRLKEIYAMKTPRVKPLVHAQSKQNLVQLPF